MSCQLAISIRLRWQIELFIFLTGGSVMIQLFMAGFFLLLSIFCQALVSFGASIETFCGNGNTTTTVVVFGNGIMNNERDANNSLKVLRDGLRASLSSEDFSKLEFKVAYNRSYGFMGDLYESLRQRRASDNFSVSFWRWIGNLEAVPEDVRQFINTAVAEFDVSEHFGTEDIANHLAFYRTSIAEGKKVLLVSHSQGNLFANAAYQVLYEDTNHLATRSFGIVAVATPASFVAGGGSYVTLSEDVVITAIAATSVAAGTVPPLAPNVTNVGDGTDNEDWKGHSFGDAYMIFGSRSESIILSDIFSVIASLESPNQIAQEGIITLTLSWGQNPDVDLHVLEPLGIHIYYSSPQGQFGYLDVDDTDGWGPEHYYVSCEDLTEGTFRVGVNYFQGNFPEQALVQIKAGSSIRSFSIDLPQAYGYAGDENPTALVDIVVSGDVANGFSFDIQEL